MKTNNADELRNIKFCCRNWRRLTSKF